MITIVEYNPAAKSHVVLEKVDWRQFQKKPDHLYWWDLLSPTREEEACLSEYFHFHHLAIQDCLAMLRHPKLDFYETYLYMVIHGVDPEQSDAEGFAPRELDIFLARDFLVTYHTQRMRSVASIMERLADDSPMFDYGPDFVLYSILDVLVNNYLPMLDDLEEKQDALEEEIFDRPKPEQLRKILEIKRTLMELKRTVFPQREVINHLARNEYEMVQAKNQFYFRDIYDMLYRMAEMIESFRDVSTSQIEIYLSTVSNKMNEIMKVLAVAATIFGSMTVIAGIYGMNFEHMPELHWHYGYFFSLGLMALVSMTLGLYFKWRGWW